MTKKVDYLTEKGLGEILSIIYANSKIEAQHKAFGKKWDYAIIIDDKDKNHVPDSVECCREEYISAAYDYEAMEMDSNLEVFDEEESFEFEEPKMQCILLIEFDGSHHYTTNSQANRDRQVGNGIGCKWEIVEHDNDFIYALLRIPYWIQLDREICKLLFNVDQDFSKGFPHGFVTKSVYTPDRFCVSGEKRFKEELSLLPASISKSVVDSLIHRAGYPNKITVNKMSQCCSIELWDYLIRNFHPLSKQLKKMEDTSPDVGKFYKHFNPLMYRLLYENFILRSLYFKGFSKSESPKKIEESIEAYCEWHSLSREGFENFSANKQKIFMEG